MSRILVFAYGLSAYLVFVGTILYAIGFVSGLPVPKTLDDGTVVPLAEAVVVDLLLMALFAMQHSVMARKSFKRWWTAFVPLAVERSTYVLLTSLVLILLFWQWRPIPTVIWRVDDLPAEVAMIALSLVGWVIVLASAFMINHFELLGLHQAASNLVGRKTARSRTPMLYGLARHPIYLGFIIAFWATPTMTAGHLLFAAVTTAYIFVGIAIEECDLVGQLGEEYRRYRRRIVMLIPWPGGGISARAADRSLSRSSR
jgi:protein-S-isoprenylcysteine O-methyltransferase Ste14